MRACFTDFITIRGTTSKSGLYINDLPGIPIEMINKMRTDDNTSLADFWAKFYERSIYTFLAEVGEKVGDKFYTNEVIESRITGEFESALNNTSEVYAGVELDYPQSKYLENQVLTILMNVDSFGSPTPKLYFFDKIGGNLLKTFELTGIQEGINTFNYFGVFDVDKLYVAFKPAEISLKKTKAYTRYYDSQELNTSIDQVNGGGLILEINNYCSLEKFVCFRIYALRYALWYHLGAELMKERILTNNINQFTHLTIEKAQQLGGMWEEDFSKKMEAAFKHLRINDDRLCIECRGAVSKRRILP